MPRPIPEAFKQTKKNFEKKGRWVIIDTGPSAHPQRFFRSDAYPGVKLKIAVPRSWDFATYVESFEDESGTWHYTHMEIES